MAGQEQVVPEVTSKEFLKQLFSLGEKIKAHREANNGFLPLPVWLKLIEIAGSYLCVELLLLTADGKPVLTIRHGDNVVGREKEWEGLLHIPGRAVMLGMRVTAQDLARAVLLKELVKEGKEEFADELARNAVFWGFARYPEPERNTIADTLILSLVIDPTDKRFKGELAILEESQIGMIEQHTQTIVEYYQNPDGGRVFDTRPTS